MEEEPNEIISSIFYYKNGSFSSINHKRSDTCENICKELCRRWNFPPLVQFLFGLRIYGKQKQIWIADSRQLAIGEKYEFRIRFKVSDLFTQVSKYEIEWLKNIFSLY